MAEDPSLSFDSDQMVAGAAFFRSGAPLNRQRRRLACMTAQNPQPSSRTNQTVESALFDPECLWLFGISGKILLQARGKAQQFGWRRPL